MIPMATPCEGNITTVAPVDTEPRQAVKVELYLTNLNPDYYMNNKQKVQDALRSDFMAATGLASDRILFSDYNATSETTEANSTGSSSNSTSTGVVLYCWLRTGNKQQATDLSRTVNMMIANNSWAVPALASLPIESRIDTSMPQTYDVKESYSTVALIPSDINIGTDVQREAVKLSLACTNLDYNYYQSNKDECENALKQDLPSNFNVQQQDIYFTESTPLQSNATMLVCYLRTGDVGKSNTIVNNIQTSIQNNQLTLPTFTALPAASRIDQSKDQTIDYSQSTYTSATIPTTVVIPGLENGGSTGIEGSSGTGGGVDREAVKVDLACSNLDYNYYEANKDQCDQAVKQDLSTNTGVPPENIYITEDTQIQNSSGVLLTCYILTQNQQKSTTINNNINTAIQQNNFNTPALLALPQSSRVDVSNTQIINYSNTNVAIENIPTTVIINNNNNGTPGSTALPTPSSTGTTNEARSAVKLDLYCSNLLYSYYTANKQTVDSAIKSDLSSTSGISQDQIYITDTKQIDNESGTILTCYVLTGNSQQSTTINNNINTAIQQNTWVTPAFSSLPTESRVTPAQSQVINLSQTNVQITNIPDNIILSGSSSSTGTIIIGTHVDGVPTGGETGDGTTVIRQNTNNAVNVQLNQLLSMVAVLLSVVAMAL